uniref:DUF4614 domain-containing protein n=1 Tax=Timema monikensis TaxID=170555 RepID=A0A7R9EG56_9NEOP|nr:unnamed protein product [Timema monikensis]
MQDYSATEEGTVKQCCNMNSQPIAKNVMIPKSKSDSSNIYSSPTLRRNQQKQVQINDDNVVFNVKTFEDLIAYQEEELQGDHSIGSPTLNLEYDDGVDNKNNSTSKLINFNLGTSDKKRRNITTNKSLEISSSNDSDDETNNISEESLKEGMLKRSNNQRNTSLKRNAKMTLSSVDASPITEEVSVILEDNGNVHNADYYSNSFQSDDIVDEQNVSHQDLIKQSSSVVASTQRQRPAPRAGRTSHSSELVAHPQVVSKHVDTYKTGVKQRPSLTPCGPVDVAINQMLRQQIQLTRHLIASLSPCGPVDVAINQMLRQQIQLTRHLIASQCAMYKAYTTSVKFMRERYKPVTLNETKKDLEQAVHMDVHRSDNLSVAWFDLYMLKFFQHNRKILHPKSIKECPLLVGYTLIFRVALWVKYGREDTQDP